MWVLYSLRLSNVALRNDPPEVVNATITSVAVGGDGVARLPSGEVVFVEGAFPGDHVQAVVHTRAKRYLKAEVSEVLNAGPERILGVCPHLHQGCGGCGWGNLAYEAQLRHKLDMVTQAVSRLGGHVDPPVELGAHLVESGFRTTVRALVDAGRGGFRAKREHRAVVVDSCRMAHPLVEELLVEGRFGSAHEVVLRAGAKTGERLALVYPNAAEVMLPSDVVVVGADELKAGRRAWYHEEVNGVTLRISAQSFFQSRHDGATALVDTVSKALVEVEPQARVADLYCGVGLFSAVAPVGTPVVAVERSASSVADAKVNLANANLVHHRSTRVDRVAVERWKPVAVDAVIADPPRSGLAKDGVAKINATGATSLALVSCDAGALGRDVSLLRASGWQLKRSTLVDLFADTPHVEVVSHFVR